MFRRLAPRATLVLVALLGLSLAMPAVAKKRGAGAKDGPTKDQIAVRQLKQQIAAEELAAALALSDDQNASLVELVSEAVTRRASHKEERQSRAPELRELLEDYLADVQEGGEASDASVEAIRSFREANKPKPEEHKEAREDVRERLKEILTEGQLAVLQDFRPMSAVGPDPERQEQRGERRKRRGEKVRERMGDEDFEEIKARQQKRKQRKKARRTVREVLFSEAMLEVLQR